jgi:hypothetical protein
MNNLSHLPAIPLQHSAVVLAERDLPNQSALRNEHISDSAKPAPTISSIAGDAVGTTDAFVSTIFISCRRTVTQPSGARTCRSLGCRVVPAHPSRNKAWSMPLDRTSEKGRFTRTCQALASRFDLLLAAR